MRHRPLNRLVHASVVLYVVLAAGGLLPSPVADTAALGSAALVSPATGVISSVPPGQAPPEVGAAALDSAVPTLVEIDEQHVVLEWQAPPYELTRRALDGQLFDQVSVPGCSPAGRPGEPELPVCGVLLGVPPDARLSLRILEEEPVLLPGSFHLAPVPEPVIEEELPPAGPDSVRIAGRRWTEGEAYASDHLFPEQPARLGEPAFLRHQRLVPISIFPLQYRPQSGELLYHPRLRLEITFADAREPMGYVAEPSGFERLLANTLLNYPQARNWRRTTQVPLDIPPPPPDPGWRIPISEEGVYKLTYQRLQAAGLPVDTLDPRTLRLFRYGQEVAIRVVGEGDGQFDPGDHVLFYGQPLAGNRYTAAEVYWLTYGGAAGRRMRTRDGTPGGGAPVPPSYVINERLEQNLRYYSQVPWRADHDHWLWNYTYPNGGIYNQTYSFPPHPLLPQPYTATLRLYLYSMTSDEAVNPDHHIRVFVNGVEVSEMWWDGRIELTPTVAFSSALLQPSGNEVLIESPGDTGAFGELIIYDWLELEHRRLFTAEADTLSWDGTAGEWEYHLDNFTEPAIHLLDVRDPDSVIEIVSATVVPGGSTYSLYFADQVTVTTAYRALAGGQVLEPASISLAAPADLRNPANGADYIVISHGDFYTQALALANFRAGQGLRAIVVNVGDLYDLFAYGRPIPEAIHDFLAYAYTYWSVPAPGDVVLLGDGHWDPKGYWGYGMGEFILPYLAFVDPWTGETAADNRYVCLSGGDTLPDMNLGRLPANSPAEAQTVVLKIVAYEGSPPPGQWRQQSLFAADDPDQAGNFWSLSDQLIAEAYPSPYGAQRVYLGNTCPYQNPSVTCRDEILTGIDEGQLLVNYIGHGGRFLWAFEYLLSNADVPALHNGPFYPVVLAMTCSEGAFHFAIPIPAYYSLAETYVRAEDKGWIASWSPTGLGVATGHHYLNEGFFQAVFFDDQRRLGPATLAGKLNLYASGSNLYLLDTYLLFGDPAMGMAVLQTDLSMQKSVQPATPLHPGEPVTFTLHLANAGPATAHHIVLTDTLSPLLVSSTVSAAGVSLSPRPGLTYTWDLADMVAGQAGTVTITARVAPDAPAGFIVNQARAATTAWETDRQNNVGRVSLLVAAGLPAQITVTAAPPALPADGASLSLLHATVLDAGGHPVADGTPVRFGTDAGTFLDGGTIYTASCDLGSAEVLLRAAGEVTTATVSAAAGSAWSQVQVPFLPLAPYTVTVWAEPAAIPVTGTAHVTATVEDAIGHPVADGTPVTFTTSLGTIAPALRVTRAGLVTTTLQADGRDGLATVVARSGPAAGATQVRIGAGAGLTLTLAVSPSAIPADGLSQAAVTATLWGPGSQPVTSTHWVTFSTTLGEIPTGTWAVSGTGVVSLIAGTTPGTALVVASSEGASAWTTVRLLPGGPATLTLTAVPEVLPVGGHQALLTAVVRDAGGNPVADGTPITFSTSLGTVTPTLGTTRYGQALAVLSSGTQVGTATVLARSGPASDTAAVPFLPLSPVTLTLAADPPVLVADGASTATLSVWVGDPFGNPVKDGTVVQLLTTMGQVLPAGVTTAQGWATATLRVGTEVGTATVQAFAGTAQGALEVPLIPGPPAVVLVTANPARLVADGVSTAAVSARVWDGYGHAVADGTEVSFTTSLGVITPEVALTQGGWAYATLRSAAQEGWATVRAESGSAWDERQVEFFLCRIYLPLVLRR